MFLKPMKFIFCFLAFVAATLLVKNLSFTYTRENQYMTTFLSQHLQDWAATTFENYSVQDQTGQSNLVSVSSNATTQTLEDPLKFPWPNISYTECFSNVVYVESSPPWQLLKFSNWTIFLYGAYWDHRTNSKAVSTSSNYSVRIIGKISKRFTQSELSAYKCFIWYENESGNVSLLVQEVRYKRIIPAAAVYQTYLMSCSVPASKFPKEQPPVGVSLMDVKYYKERKQSLNFSCSDMPNFLPVVYKPFDPEKKLDFAICHKALYFDKVDASKMLIEWLEIHRLLGVKQVFIYEYFSIPGSNISNTLQYYKSQGFVQTRAHTLPEITDHSPASVVKYLRSHQMDKWVNELVPYHACFFENMYKFKYIALIDIDEVIMPINTTSWAALVHDHETAALNSSKTPVGGFSFQNNIFPENEHNFSSPDAPEDSRLLQQIFRIQSKSYTPNRKLIYATSVSLIMHNHYSVFCLDYKKCRIVMVSPSVGRLHHFCIAGAKSCRNKDHVSMQVDLTLWKFKGELISAVEKVHQDLGFHSNSSIPTDVQTV